VHISERSRALLKIKKGKKYKKNENKTPISPDPELFRTFIEKHTVSSPQ